MNKRIGLVAVTMLLLVSLVAPAGASTGVRPTFRTEDVFFKCHGDTKVYQVNWLAGIGNQSTYMKWNTEAPTQSVTDGAGCGALDTGGTTNAVYSPTFLGYYEGNLRDMTVRLHHLLLSNTRGGQPMNLSVHLVVDGEALCPPGPTQGCKINVTPTPSETGASEVFEFSLTNLGFSEDVVDEQGNVVGTKRGGFAREDGDGKHEYEILLMVGLTEYPRPGAWVWDTTEVPSGITFNPDKLAAATAKVTLPK
ncbi:MAG TPA: hypothetical protein VM307_04320 [Egibacteraceae bacterium]|nr:hypothetical protein [Egibacteraceae bacterium]